MKVDNLYSHRNGEADDPEIDGHYWCWWGKDEDDEDSYMVIMSWHNGNWWWGSSVDDDDKPDKIYGPITRPEIKE